MADEGQEHLKNLRSEAQRVKGVTELRGRMRANYESPGLRGESTRDRDEATYISDKFRE